VGVQRGGAGEHGAASGREANMPVVQHRRDRRDAAGATDLGDQRDDLFERVAAPPELVGSRASRTSAAR
jgi:hypothetical protein